ncbi:MAG: hypothetical protein GY849_00650 [Deltaproteobacteria bacterium]|nr:hypothetical protein [Deltaproteobacteria bacterium]
MKQKKIIIIGNLGNKELLQQIINSKIEAGFEVQCIDEKHTEEIKRLGLSECIDKNKIFTEIEPFELKLVSQTEFGMSINKKKKNKQYPKASKYHC